MMCLAGQIVLEYEGGGGEGRGGEGRGKSFIVTILNETELNSCKPHIS